MFSLFPRVSVFFPSCVLLAGMLAGHGSLFLHVHTCSALRVHLRGMVDCFSMLVHRTIPYLCLQCLRWFSIGSTCKKTFLIRIQDIRYCEDWCSSHLFETILIPKLRIYLTDSPDLRFEHMRTYTQLIELGRAVETTLKENVIQARLSRNGNYRK